MKCEIIRDLLPLYIENLCSEESCREVEAHLAACGRCRAEYRNMTAEVPVAETDEERVQKILKEAVFNPAVLFRHIPDNGLYESR